MKQRVVAEYLETEEALALLAEIGVDFAQGYLIAEPVLLERLTVDLAAP